MGFELMISPIPVQRFTARTGLNFFQALFLLLLKFCS